MAEVRLDLYIKEKMNISRQKAQQLISDGCVSVNDKCVLKPSYKISDIDIVNIQNINSVLKYVGRGGYKLEKAISEFELSLDGICLDIGASTGGFTDCMLQNGAQLVYAVDVGSDQLADSLRNDKRVVSMENCDIRRANIPQVDFIGCDVSFISLSAIFESASKHLKDNGCGVFLIKPQFEVGRENISKNGIVKNPKAHKKAIRDVLDYAQSSGLYPQKLTYSPIKGGDGNIEYLLLVDKQGTTNVNQQLVNNSVEDAFNSLKDR